MVEVPRLMERVVGGLGRLPPPVWRPDPEFDLDYHVRTGGAAGAGHDAPAARPGDADLPGPLRPHPAAVDVLRDRRARGRRRGDGLEDPPHRRRRHRRGPPVRSVHPADARGARAAGGRPRRRARRARSPPTTRPGGNPSVVDSIVGTATHFARRQAGITRRLAGEMAMLRRRPAARPRRGRRRRQGDQPAAQRAARRRRAAAARGSCTTASRSCRAARRCGATARATATSR